MRHDLVEQAKAIKAVQDKLAQRFDGITALRNSLPKVPTIKDFIEFLRNLDKLIRG